jgi:hypothetical protein
MARLAQAARVAPRNHESPEIWSHCLSALAGDLHLSRGQVSPDRGFHFSEANAEQVAVVKNNLSDSRKRVGLNWVTGNTRSACIELGEAAGSYTCHLAQLGRSTSGRPLARP